MRAVLRLWRRFSPRVGGVRARLILILLAGLVVGCSKDAPQNYLRPEGPIATGQDKLWNLTFGIATVVFFLVEGALLFAVFKFKQRTTRDAPKQTHGNNKLEVGWTLAPAVLLALITIPTIQGVYSLAEAPEDNALNVEVLAKQWWWQYTYEDSGVVTANELHIPVGRTVLLRLKSEDVIHSFWVPKLAGKQDVVPGRTNTLKIEADKPGSYKGQCVEYCGLSHANMKLIVIAHEEDDFQDWVRSQQAEAQTPSAGLPVTGQRLFLEGACAGCHAVNGTEAQSTVGPNLTHFASRSTFAGSMYENTEPNLVKWLQNPPGRKPGSKMPDLNLSDDEIKALVAYLQSLS